MPKTDNQAQVGMHVFERAGLGKAPFRCIGYAEVVYQASPDAPRQPGGSCDYCGTGIFLQCQIKAADGKTFKVGSDCVAKTGDHGLIKSFKTHPAVRQARREKAKVKDQAVIAEWNRLIEDPANIAKLSAVQVAGRPWIAGEQVTLLDNMKRIWGMCGAAGRVRNLKILKGKLAE